MDRTTEAVRHLVTHLATAQKLVSGDSVLLIYYIIILLFFFGDLFIKKHMDRIVREDPLKFDESILKFFEFYRHHGYLFILAILYCICVFLTIRNEGLDWSYLFTISISFIIFAVIMYFFLKFFINRESYENLMFIRYINVICYLILGNLFSFFMPFVKPPNLLFSFFGLVLGLLACIHIMIRAIFNPEILKRTDATGAQFGGAFGIIKGMLGVVVCILALEFLMIYSCFITNPNFYQAGNGRALDAWDMFYYLIISFSTIGYGDIYPVRFNGMFYSEFTAIIIGITSMFTTGCFIAAVISTANNIAENKRKSEIQNKNNQEKNPKKE